MEGTFSDIFLFFFILFLSNLDNDNVIHAVYNKLSQNGFEVQSNFFEAWKGKVNNAYSYLIHRTEDASEKHQYTVDEVIANFDYAERIENIESKIQSNSRKGKKSTNYQNLYINIISVVRSAQHHLVYLVKLQ
nr:Rep family protein [Streptococcus suis]